MVGRPTDTQKRCSEQKDDCTVGMKTSREYTETLDVNHYLKKAWRYNLVQTLYSTGKKTEVFTV